MANGARWGGMLGAAGAEVLALVRDAWLVLLGSLFELEGRMSRSDAFSVLEVGLPTVPPNAKFGWAVHGVALKPAQRAARVLAALSLMLALTSVNAALVRAAQINPVPLPVRTEPIQEWTFEESAQRWTGWHNCSLSADEGVLKIRCTGPDPYFGRSVRIPGGDLLLELTIRSNGQGSGSIYWATDASPEFGEDKSRSFSLVHDNRWQDVSVRFTADGTLQNLRIDPGQDTADVEIRSIRLIREISPPVTLERVELDNDAVRVTLKNQTSNSQTFSLFGDSHSVEAEEEVTVERALAGSQPLEPIHIELAWPGFPSLHRTLFACHPSAAADWITRETPHYRLRVAPDGSMAAIERAGTLTAVLAPLVHCDGRVPKLELAEQPADQANIEFRGEGISVAITCSEKEISVRVDSAQPCEGPVVRALGSLEQGLFAGLEYLDRGEASSSTLDIRTPEHLRFAPDPLLVTMPLMTFVTDRGTVALTWDDMALQPIFATPNFFDGTADHRMALRGQKIHATILVGDESVEDTILWAVRRHELPPLPTPPRTPEEQRQLCLQALNGPLKTDEGWGHCVEDHWPRRPFADMASTIWRLTGEVPPLPRLVPGGSHITNDSIYFVTGRADRWLRNQRRQAEMHRRRQGADGSYRYDGPYREGHFEDTALGVCAQPAVTMLEYARITGDQEILAAACRTLDYMKRFRVPRGAQVWEIPLHTPDQLASAYAVWAYVRGYELTGREDYLAEARRWALSGIPFVYLWGSQPIMLYGTPPVYGATNWVAPLWIGLPVQWVGGVYAYALTMLAPHDSTLNWNHLAKGILITAQQMQYPDGPNAGLLPDSLELRAQERRPWNINPCALISLELVLDGQVDFLSVAHAGQHRVAAPLPVSIEDGKAIIRGRPGLDYQVIVNGRVIDVRSQGMDIIPLE